MRQLPGILARGPEAYGFQGSFWTCERIAEVIEREFGVRYHRDHVRRLLHRVEWTYQKPGPRASQRDEVAIVQWLTQTWPAMKKRAEKEARTIVFVDESGFYLAPAVSRTWSPARI